MTKHEWMFCIVLLTPLGIPRTVPYLSVSLSLSPIKRERGEAPRKEVGIKLPSMEQTEEAAGPFHANQSVEKVNLTFRGADYLFAPFSK